MPRCALRLCIRGFTPIELLVVIAIIAILAALLLPSLNRTKQKAQGIYCMNNTKQMMLAWTLYATDNADKIVYNRVTSTSSGWHNMPPASPPTPKVEVFDNRSTKALPGHPGAPRRIVLM